MEGIRLTSPARRSLTPPRINLDLFPSEEVVSIGWRLQNSLGSLLAHARTFDVALALFDYSNAQLASIKDENEPSPPFKEWRSLAGRDGALSLFHFGNTIEVIRKVAKNSPTLSAHIDGSALCEVQTLVDQTFPGWKGARHAVAHFGEFFSDPAAADKHSAQITPYMRVAYYNRLEGRRFEYTYRREICGYELSKETSEKILTITIQFYPLFANLSVDPSRA